MKKVLSIIFAAVILTTLLMPAAFAADNNDLLYDTAGILSEDEASKLQSAIAAVNEKYNIDVSILTVYDYKDFFLENFNKNCSDLDEAAECFCNSGVISEDCVLLIMSTSERDYRIASNEKGHDAFTKYGREYIDEAIKDSLSDDNYIEAFTKFIDLADEFIAEYEKGTPYDTNHKKMGFFDYLIRFGVPLGAGLVVGIIAVFVVNKKYKPVQLKAEANDYLIPGSLQVHNAYDRFIYTHVTRTAKPKNNSSSSSDSGSFGSTGGKY